MKFYAMMLKVLIAWFHESEAFLIANLLFFHHQKLLIFLVIYSISWLAIVREGDIQIKGFDLKQILFLSISIVMSATSFFISKVKILSYLLSI